MNVLLVEDDPVLQKSLGELLTEAGYRVLTAGSLREARALRDEGRDAQLCLIDLMLPDGSGLSLCREIRAREDVPILCLTALDDEESVIAGLSAGADDYVAKPFRARELLARIEANLRRTAAGADALESGELRYCLSDERVYLAGQELLLRKAERTLLRLMLESGGRLLKRDYILYRLWDSEENFVEENTLSVLVSRLRKALGRTDGCDYIETVRGVGYRWRPPIRRTQGGSN